MKNIELYEPTLEDYWYEQKLLSDQETMSYNAGYDVAYDGYHYDTGCIDFPKEKWKAAYIKRQEVNRYFAYIKDKDEFVGYVNDHYNKKDNRYDCGIVVETKKRGKGYSKMGLRLLCNKAREKSIDSLYDSFEIDRNSALKTFESVGVKVVEECTWNKFSKEVSGVLVRIDLN